MSTVIMPKMGDGMEEGTLLRWLKGVGDEISTGDPLAEIETDKVTLEIEDATIGGLAMAVGMTTHSHKVGLLFETVVAYEVIIADGTLLRVTRDEHPDLFHALPWSHGTLGLLVALDETAGFGFDRNKLATLRFAGGYHW